MKNTLLIENLSKTYGAVEALRDVNLAIPMGEFTCFLGPSGCGKTTLLRLIAGFEHPTNGRIVLNGKDITSLPPQKRELGMVFQSLALFPHMTVAGNIAYGLRRKHVPLGQRERRVEELLALTSLQGLKDRPVTTLSGGQRQRVAIARALAVEPKLFLLDEPLSALDAKLREQMQVELRDLQQRLKITTLFVTHDQAEAMMLADQMAVFSEGRVQQVGKPGEVYRHPATPFVADFLGAANVISGEVTQDGHVQMLGTVLRAVTHLRPRTPVSVVIRPEDLELASDGNTQPVLGTLHLVRNLGFHREILVDCQSGERLRCRSSARIDELGKVGDKLALHVRPQNILVLAAQN